MGTISQLRNKLKALDIEFESEVAIEDTKQAIIEKQKDQLLHGFTGKDRRIGKYRNSKYANMKFLLNPLAGSGNVDLKLTGAFYNDIFVNVRPKSIVIDSANDKTERLIAKYGDPFGLDKFHRTEYINEVLRKKFIEQIKLKIGL